MSESAVNYNVVTESTYFCKNDSQFVCLEEVLSMFLIPNANFLIRFRKLDKKRFRAILLCPWEKTLYGTFPCLVVLASSLNFRHISIKLQTESNILASPEAVRGNCLLYILPSPSLSCESEE